MTPASSLITSKYDTINRFIQWLVSRGTTRQEILDAKQVAEEFYSWLITLSFGERTFSKDNFLKYRQYLLRQNLNQDGFNEKVKQLKLFGKFLPQSGLALGDPTTSLSFMSDDEAVTPAPKESIFDEFSRYLRSEKLSPITIKNYLRDTEQFFAWFNQFEKGVEVNFLAPKIIQTYRRYLQQQLNMAPASIDRKISSLRKFFNWASEEGLFTSSPFGKDEDNNLDSLVSPANAEDLKKSRKHFRKLTRYWKLVIPSIAVLLIVLLIAFKPWQRFFPQTMPQEMVSEITDSAQNQEALIYQGNTSWIIHFSGKIKDNAGKPVLDQSKIVFSLHDSEMATHALWTSKVWDLQPTKDGVFSVRLGDTNNEEQIDPSLFFQHKELFLSTHVNGKEFTPRTRISTSSLAANTWALRGFAPSLAVDKNQIPVVDSEGRLVFVSESPEIKSSNGTLGIEGKAVTISVPYDSNENITLSPMGGGGVEIISNKFSGSVLNVLDSQLSSGTLISATLESASSSANLLQLQAGITPTPKFTVDSNGNTSITGKLKGIGDLRLSDDRTEVVLSDSSNTSLPSGSQSILGALATVYSVAEQASKSASLNQLVWEKSSTYLKPKDNETVRIYDSNGTDYVEIKHDGTDTLFSTQNTDNIKFDTQVVIDDNLLVNDSITLSEDLKIAGKIYNESGGDIIIDDNLVLSNEKVLTVGGSTSRSYNSLAGSTTTSHSLNNDTDLYIEGRLEIDNNLYSDGNAYFGGNVDVSGSIANQGGSVTIDDDLQFTSGRSITTSAGSLILNPANGLLITSNTFFPNQGIWNTDGNLGIGNTNPSQKLDINGAIRLGNTGSNNVLNTQSTGAPAENDLYWGNSKLLTELNLGQFGVSSVSNNDGTLTISPTTGVVEASLNLSNSNTWLASQIFSTTTYVTTLDFNNNTISDGAMVGNWSLTGGDLNNVGNISASNVTLSSPGDVISLTGDGATIAFNGLGLAQITSASNHHIALMPGGTGNVGIGSTNPEYKLDVAGATNATAYYLNGSLLGVLQTGTLDGQTVYWNGSTWTPNSGLFYSSSTLNVGIGTTSPQAKLDVSGGIRLGDANGEHDVLNTSIGTSDPSGTLYWGNRQIIDSTNISNFGVTSINSNDGSLTITSNSGAVNAILNPAHTNTWTADQTFDTGTTVTISGDLSVADENISLTGSNTNFTSAGNISFNANQLILDQTQGNIGIGLTNPGYKLSINGSIAVASGYDFFIGGIGIGSTGATSGASLIGTLDEFDYSDSFTVQEVLDDLDYQINQVITGAVGIWTDSGSFVYPTVAGQNSLVVTDTGRVGIGTTSPYNKLDVVGSVAVGSPLSQALPQANMLYVSGNVGIGTTNPQTELDVMGSIQASENISAGGIIAGGTLTDGTLTISQGHLNTSGNISATNLTATGDVDANTGTIFTLDGNSFTFTTGTITNNLALGGSLAFATNTISDGAMTGNWDFSGGTLSGINDLTAEGSITFSSLSTGVIQSDANGILSTNLGITNYLPKWDANGLTSVSLLYDNGISLGVGTTDPGTRLDVVGGSIRTDGDFYGGDIYLGYDNADATLTTADTDESLTLDPNGTGSLYLHGNTYYIDSASLGYLSGLATTNYTPAAGEVRADVFRDGNSNYYIQPADPGTAGVFAGSIGIGTTPGAFKLDVNGSLRIVSGSDITLEGETLRGTQLGDRNYASNVYVTDLDSLTTAIGTLDLNLNEVETGVAGVWRLTGSNLYPSSTEYNITIGTTNPQSYKLYVQGSSYLSGTLGVGSSASIEDSLTVFGTTTLADTLTVTGTTAIDTNTLYVDSTTHNVGVGTTNPIAKLDISNGIRLGEAGGQYDILNTAVAGGDPSGLLYWGNKTIITSDNVGTYGVTSISSDNTLTVDPQFGDVQITLNVNNPNTWTGEQTFSNPTTFNNTAYFPGSGTWSSSGNVGVGTTATDIYTLNVNGSLYADTVNTGNGDHELYGIEKDLLTSGTGISITGGGDNVLYGPDGDITIAHADTSTQANVNNSDGTVIQGITLDNYGHLTGIVSYNLDNRYYTEVEADDLFVDESGDTMTGTLTFSGVATDLTTINNEHLSLIPHGTGNVGVGTSTPLAKLHVSGGNTIFDGSVGIGTTPGSNALNVSGNTYLSGILGVGSSASIGSTLQVTGKTILDSTLGVSGATTLSSTLEVSGTTTIDGGTLYISNNTRNVGIGLTNPQEKLNVDGNFLLTGILQVGGSPSGLLHHQFGNGTKDETAIADANDVYISGDLEIDGTLYAANIVGMITGSGTDNFLPRWNGTTALEDSIIYDTGTNIGIGTTDPQARLQVAGDILPTDNDQFNLGSSALRWGNLYLGGETLHIGTTTGDEGTISYTTDNNNLVINSTGNVVLQSTSGNVGIGTTNPQAPLEIKTNTSELALVTAPSVNGNSVARLMRTGTSDYATFEFANGTPTTPTARWGVGLRETGDDFLHFYSHALGADAIVINNTTGNIGIGTTDPQAKLTLVDHATATGGILFGTDTTLYRRTADTLKTDDGFEANSYAVGITTVIDSSRNLNNISTISSTYLTTDNSYVDLINSAELRTGGTARLSNTGSLQNITGYSQTSGNFSIAGAGSLNYRNLLFSDGTKVGIGTTAPTQLLHLSGGGIGIDSHVPAATDNTLYNSSSTLYWNGNPIAIGGSISGTTNYLAKFTGTNSVGISPLFDDNGNIGIGTTVPLQKLHVAEGDVTVDSGYGFRVDNSAPLGQYLRGDGTRFVSSAIQASDLPGSFSGFANPTAEVGLTAVNGTATTAMRSDAAPALSQAIAPTWTGIHTFTENTYFPGQGVWNTSGNVGIGTTNPGTYKLNVNGSLIATDYYSGDGTQGASTTTNGLVFKDGLYTSGSVTGFDNYDHWTIQDGDTTTYTIENTDTLQITEGTGIDSNFTAENILTIALNTTYTDDRYLMEDASDVWNEAGSALTLRFEGDTDENMLYLNGATNNVGIGTSSPLYKLDVVGQINASTGLCIDGNCIAGWDEISGTAYTAGNGLTLNGSEFELGGTLNRLTTIDLNSNDLAFFGTGNVGIGTTSPDYKLHVLTSNNAPDGILVRNDTNDILAGAALVLESATARGILTSYPTSFAATHFADRVALVSEGGLGDSYDAAGLDLVATDTLADIRFYTGGSGISNERVRIAADGNVGIGTVSPGTNLEIGTTSKTSDTIARVLAGDSYNAGFEAFGASQGTGYFYAGQSGTYGGGFFYNGDGSPAFATGESADQISFYRNNNGIKEVVFSYPYSSNNVSFRGNITATGTLSASGYNSTNWDAAYAHISSSGADHSYIDQSVTTSASPTFANLYLADNLIHSGDTNTYVGFPAADTVRIVTAGDERLRVLSNGNVGIGEASPAQKLEVAGHIRLNTTSAMLEAEPNQSLVLRQSGTGSLHLQSNGTFYFVQGTSTNRASIDSTTGNLWAGGNITADGSLYVTGSIYDNDDGNVNIGEALYVSGTITSTSSLNGTAINTGYGDFEIGQNLRTSDQPSFSVVKGTGWGGLQLYTSSATQFAHFHGHYTDYIEINTNTGYRGISTFASSQKYKKNITDLEIDSSMIYNLRPVSFNWKTQEDGAQKTFGLIAEETLTHIPELIRYDSNGEILTVIYELIPVLNLKEIQKHEVKIASHSALLADLNLTDTGDLTLSGDSYTGLLEDATPNTLASLGYSLRDSSGNLILRVGAFKDIMAGGIKASFAEVKNFVAETAFVTRATVAERLLVGGVDIGAKLKELEQGLGNVGIGSPVATTSAEKLTTTELETSILSPIPEEDLQVALSGSESLSVTNEEGTEVASIDSTGKGTFAGLMAQEASVSGLRVTEATVAGTLTAKSATTDTLTTQELTATDASLSGELFASSARFKTLEAEQIKAAQIEGLEATIGKLLAASMSANQVEVKPEPTATPTPTPEPTPSPTPEPTQEPVIASGSAAIQPTLADTWEEELDELLRRMDLMEEATASGSWTASNTLAYDTQLTTTNLDAETGLFSTFLGVTGTASIVNVEVTNTLVVNDTMHLTQNSISVIGGEDETLYLQKTGLGKVDILAGAVTIDSTGNMNVNGDLYLQGSMYAHHVTTQTLTTNEATVSGSLFASLIQGVEGDVTVMLKNSGIASDSAAISDGIASPAMRDRNDGRFNIANETGSVVASIDASGSAKLKKIVIADAKEASPSGTLGADATSNATAGTAILPANQQTLTIQNTAVTNDSLIYITPTSNTYNKVLFVKNKTGHTENTKGSFTVSINSPLPYPIEFNWWIIN